MISITRITSKNSSCTACNAVELSAGLGSLMRGKRSVEPSPTNSSKHSPHPVSQYHAVSNLNPMQEMPSLSRYPLFLQSKAQSCMDPTTGSSKPGFFPQLSSATGRLLPVRLPCKLHCQAVLSQARTAVLQTPTSAQQCTYLQTLHCSWLLMMKCTSPEQSMACCDTGLGLL
jgi:hypothetical protein